MRKVAVLFSLAAVAVGGCAIRTNDPGSNDSGEARAAAPEKIDRPAAREGAPSAAGDDGVSLTARRIPAGDCEAPDRLKPAKPGAGMPQVVAPDSFSVERSQAMIELHDNGSALVRFELSVRNAGDGPGELLVGYRWRRQGTGPSEARRPPFSPELESGQAEMHSCAEPGPEKMRQPFTDEVHWIERTVEAGGSARVRGMYRTELERADKPATLFGHHDRFADNWKNWDWPYTKAEAYGEIAERLHPFHGSFSTLPAEETRIALSSAEGKNWMRGMSHEQSVTRMRRPGTFEWRFERDDLPAAVTLEYLPGLGFGEEIAVFQRLAEERNDDLRARIRLADLHRFGGDASRRAEVLEELLDRWKANAKDQMLTGRNDFRLSAHVALVRALDSLGETKKASRLAAAGAEILDQVDESRRTERHRLAAGWLRSFSAD
ncbi:MAG: hypothetical protein R6V85_09280 [Polyangia bacterium]